MDADLEAQLEDLASLVEAINKDRARLEDTSTETLAHLTTVATHLTEAAQSLTAVPDRLAQSAETMTRQASTFVGSLRWFPWKLAAAISGALVVVLCALNLFWIAQFSAAHRHTVETLEQYKALALALDRHLMETLYDQLSPGRQRKLDHVYRRAQVVPPGDRTTHTGREGR